jgi:hypothetical protein
MAILLQGIKFFLEGQALSSESLCPQAIISLTLWGKKHRNRLPLRNRWWVGRMPSGGKFNPDAVSNVAKVINSLW